LTELLFLLEVALLLLLFSAAVFGDFIPSLKKASAGEKVFGIAVYVLGFTVLLLATIKVEIPGPSNIIMNIIKAIFGPIKP